ncbi:MAG: hypothetical protein HC929_08290 [Leptolyngbyaceae cyanobacterium SM2_5_2]|nr:hypothetical protein [Leptolyngbyaceae cyanobacterium SM2_5_2]
MRYVLYGSLRGLDRVIKILHRYGYADPNNWCEPIPVPTSGASASGEHPPTTEPPKPWMVVMDRSCGWSNRPGLRSTGHPVDHY